MDEVRLRLIQIADIVALDSPILANAIRCQRENDLSPQDALVYASVLSLLKINAGVRSCFLSRDAKDFAEPGLMDKLREHKCKFLSRFDSGCAYVLNSLS